VFPVGSLFRCERPIWGAFPPRGDVVSSIRQPERCKLPSTTWPANAWSSAPAILTADIAGCSRLMAGGGRAREERLCACASSCTREAPISERVFSGRDGPNADTLYAIAFFDAGKEPWVLGIPRQPDVYDAGPNIGALLRRSG
jgi:hypothetical protein